MRRILFAFFALFLTLPAHALSVINDTQTEKLLYKLITPVATAANIPENRLKIHIVNNDDFNAFVNGGEDVFIYTGLLTRIKNPNALQAVVAHELGHMVGGHMAQMSARMEAEMKRTLIIQALGVGANINPNGLVTVFEQMQDMTGAAEAKINKNKTNHPLTAERLNNAREKISKIEHSGKYTGYSDKEFELVRAKLIGYLYQERQILDKYPYKHTEDAAIYARSIGNMRGGALDSAKMGVETLIKRDGDNPYYYELLGDIEYQLGHYDDSVAAYEHALKLDEDAPQIQTALALVLSERQKPDDTERGVSLCKASLLAEPAPLTYWVLAKLYKDGRSYWAMAEFYNMNGDKKKAKKFAKQAQKNLNPDTPEYIKAGDILNM